MNAQVTQILGEIVKRYGVESLDDSKRFAGLLQDYCKGEYKRERKSLVDALDENIPNNLLNLSKSMGRELLVDQQTRRLFDSRMMSEDAARDIVETWALALGVLNAPLTRPPVMVQPSPVGTPTPLPLPSAKSKKSAVQISLLVGIGGIGLLILIVIIGGVSWLLNGSNKPSNVMNAENVQANDQETLTVLGGQTPTISAGSKNRTSAKDGMEMVYIPPGEFLMGSTDSDSEAEANEKPQHRVYLDGYWMDKTEVTNVMYQKCVADGSCQEPQDKKSSTHNDYYGNDQYANYPVINVDWNQAQAYCKWDGGSLPSEAQWEKAGRGEDGRKYPWGDQSPTCSLANYNECGGDTKAVGSLTDGASPYGVMDMSGNVWEWVNDWYGENYYQNSPQKYPTGPNSGTGRVLRGGSFPMLPGALRSACRGGFKLDSWGSDLGFRCVGF